MKRSNIKLSHRMAAVFTVGMVTGMSGTAFAGGNNFSNVSTNIMASSANIPNLITTVAYVGGVGLGVAGVLKLKGHVDAPQQVPLKDGLVRIGAGGALLAFPMLLESMTETIGASMAMTKVTDLGTIMFGM